MARDRSGTARPQELTGFGLHPRRPGIVLRSEDLRAITTEATLSRGLGRAYGDAALPADSTRPLAGTLLADRLLSFAADSGVLRAEAGVSLATLNRLFLPRGFFTPVSPGTAYVTLGGMVAADIHGKNHHVAGTFGEHVRSLTVRVGDGRVLDVREDDEPELFRATLGGMGLLGHILEVEVQLERIPSPWIWRESERTASLEESIELLKQRSAAWPMTMAWIDTARHGSALGRGIVISGRWAEPGEAPAHPPQPHRTVGVPVMFPNGIVNRHTLALANSLYYRMHGAHTKTGIVHPGSFFYPLDVLLDWNRGYGKRGFVQYQTILPSDAGVWRAFFERFQTLGGASLTTVFKDCGAQGRGMLSFPKPGTSIALDIPMEGAATQKLVDGLNEFALEHGGRIYLAKDALTRPEHFAAMYPRLAEWNAVRHKWDPDRRLTSALSQRLLGDAE